MYLNSKELRSLINALSFNLEWTKNRYFYEYQTGRSDYESEEDIVYHGMRSIMNGLMGKLDLSNDRAYKVARHMIAEMLLSPNRPLVNIAFEGIKLAVKSVNKKITLISK